MLLLIALATFSATLFGGLFAIRFKDRLHLILGFSAGAVIGVAFFDLMPEAIELGAGLEPATILTIAAAGFIFYMILDRFIAFHAHSHVEDEPDEHDHPPADHRGPLGAASLSIHSFLDGLAIGLAYQVSLQVALIVTVAVLTHDFSDGINTVSLILKNRGQARKAFRWLLIDAVAPVLGIFAANFFSLSQQALGVVLAVFSGFFLYIGASDLLPESHHRHPKVLTTVMTVLGVAVLYAAVRLAG